MSTAWKALAVAIAFSAGVASAQKAHTGPVTANVVTVTVSWGHRAPAMMMVREGELSRFGDGHTTLGLVARLQPEGEAITIRIFEILALEGGAEGLVLLHKASLEEGEHTDISTHEMRLSVIEVQRVVPYQPAKDHPPGVDDCCVFCANIWACAGCVRVECGCCCDEGFCVPRCTENCPRPPR